jgi:hypothetical protein
MLTTTNGGLTWTQIPNIASALYKVFFADVNTGWAVGIGLLKTDNGGLTWYYQYPGTSYLNSVYFVSPTYGWVVGNDGFIKYTTNGGQTWISQSADTTADLYCAYFTSAAKGWAGGSIGTFLNYNDPTPDVGVKENVQNEINFGFPNPANTQLNFTLVRGSVKIYDRLGKLVKEQNLDEKNAMDVSNFLSGLYFIEIQNDSFKHCQKLIIQH